MAGLKTFFMLCGVLVYFASFVNGASSLEDLTDRQDYEDLICHGWTASDIKGMGPSRTPQTEKNWCENKLGYTFTQGQNKNYPSCSTCWCCKPRPSIDQVVFVARTTKAGDTSTGVAIGKNNEIVVFKDCPVNVGDGYNPNDGKFTAPVAGMYKFSTHVCNGRKARIVAAIMKGDTQLAATTIYNRKSSTCGSVDTMVQLKRGEVVTVQSRYENNRMFADKDRWLSFTGNMLFKLK